MDLKNKIAIYRSADGETQLDVKIDKETVWLNVAKWRSYSEGIQRLSENILIMLFVKNWHLDVIISVGYRVKSKNGVEFRRWANKVLKEYLVKGYAVNKAMTAQRYTELKQLVAVLGRTVKAQETLL